MNIDLNLIPATFDTVHAALAATVAGLFFLQILFLIVMAMAFCRKCRPAKAAPETESKFTALREIEKSQISPASALKTEAVVVKESMPDTALQLLGLLQNEARFIDFIQENVTGYSDADIGAAARVVHEGCVKVLRQHFELEPVRPETEGHRVTLPKGFDASSVRLTGNIVGEAPFTGTLVHRGWRVKTVKLPKITEGHDVTVVAAAEVEL